MINLDIVNCKLCGDSCEPIIPSGDLSTAKIVVVYEQPSKADYDYGQLFESRGCYFAKKQLEQHFNPKDVYYTAVKKCLNGDLKVCSKQWLDKEVHFRYTIVMGKSAYLNMSNKKAKDFIPKKVDKYEAHWYSPQLFEQRGQSFLDDFDIFCKEIKHAIEKGDN